MERKDPDIEMDRRKFLAGVVVVGTATPVMLRNTEAAATMTVPPEPVRRPSALLPNAKLAAAETETPQEPNYANGRPGSDFMVDVIKTLDIKYMPCNPASSFRGLHESLIDYGGNKQPEFLTCMHEESAVGMAHGYFKVAGKPLLTLCHGTVGLQHASMAIYNALCVPKIRFGNIGGEVHRGPAVK